MREKILRVLLNDRIQLGYERGLQHVTQVP